MPENDQPGHRVKDAARNRTFVVGASAALFLVLAATGYSELALLPMSALIRKGHSIRVAIAGHDKDTFIRTPGTGDPVIRIHRSKDHASYIDLPVVQPSAKLH